MAQLPNNVIEENLVALPGRPGCYYYPETDDVFSLGTDYEPPVAGEGGGQQTGPDGEQQSGQEPTQGVPGEEPPTGEGNTDGDPAAAEPASSAAAADGTAASPKEGKKSAPLEPAPAA